ncbi:MULTISPECIES: response regulator [Paraburkholderia]|jgi:two-component system chemotaxis response regulator CheY|uniref:Two-component system chemotaxis response regulator CheY n=2 Tax=Paraburkholderia TaxID=1822464 RepID=A0AB73I6Z6_9BURK|nr:MULTISPECIES: response regulator [Paraburkholderia]OWJ57498.1 response regulator [Burkholderia sp. Bk]MBT2791568.1 response regulator [Paraburkholderia strydomiana]MDP9645733.1 two-component system chemotaxis response regulator CheY [Paraburkholderia caledonica]MDR6375353.1 two-component system chemotaxis response regulator CheY [Paraburkholderia caledonica]MDR7006924.1 two-component system chemotaxis response regulator CheY [Paraburkholderia strydomiana]
MIRHILAIDDSASMRQILSATLTAAGYEVTLAADGAEGLENALAVRFDLVLTDQHMPGKTGLDLISELRGNPAYTATPILVLTTESGESFKAAAREAGATGWIEKPLDPDMLTELVAALAEPDQA